MYRKDKKEEYYTLKARKEGYPARSIYKLKEIDEKYHLIKSGDSVLDLGCAPGSWLLYLSRRVGEKGIVVGVDSGEIKIPPAKNTFFLKKDIAELTIEELENLSKEYQAVVSDLAPATTGMEIVDTGKSLDLARNAFEIAKDVLAPDGSFVCKIFEGPLVNDLVKQISERFKIVKRFKPQAVIKRSKELYIVALGFIPHNQQK